MPIGESVSGQKQKDPSKTNDKNVSPPDAFQDALTNPDLLILETLSPADLFYPSSPPVTASITATEKKSTNHFTLFANNSEAYKALAAALNAEQPEDMDTQSKKQEFKQTITTADENAPKSIMGILQKSHWIYRSLNPQNQTVDEKALVHAGDYIKSTYDYFKQDIEKYLSDNHRGTYFEEFLHFIGFFCHFINPKDNENAKLSTIRRAFKENLVPAAFDHDTIDLVTSSCIALDEHIKNKKQPPIPTPTEKPSPASLNRTTGMGS